MQNLKNKVQLIGNIGQTPEVINFDKERKLVKFSLATSETYKNAQGERIQETQWHHVVAWNKLGMLVETYLDKGSKIALEGKLSNRSYEDKDGNKRYVTEIIMQDMVMLDMKKPA